MNKLINPVSSLLHEAENSRRTLVLFFFISIVCHLTFFTVLVFAHVGMPRSSFTPNVIQVDLVSFSAPSQPYKPARKTTPVVQKKKKPEQAVKKETYISKDLKKTVAPAEDQSIDKIDESTPDSITDALERLKDQVEKAEDQRAAVGPAGTDRDGKQALRQIDIYNAEIYSRIRRQWALLPELAEKSESLMAVLVIKIRSDGEISDIRFEQKSGSRSFDDSCQKAVQKANPLPPLPAGYRRSYYEVGLRFTPLGLK